ncbi:MAG: polysaccharide deacetylase family protein, partial [Gammaproteobacteria bacterium]
LKSYGFPTTIYVTTYYVRHNNPIFRLVLQYFFWKAQAAKLALDGLIPDLDGVIRIKHAEQTLWRIIDYGEQKLYEDNRVDLAREIGLRLGLSYDELRQTRQLTLLTEEEIGQLSKSGFDIQLHTHRHRLPDDPDGVMQEVADNRAVLEPLVQRHLRHLCYPSGVWSENHWPGLVAAGIDTATTCVAGVNPPNARKLALARILDEEHLPQIFFEGELYGFGEALRTLRRWPRVGQRHESSSQKLDE